MNHSEPRPDQPRRFDNDRSFPAFIRILVTAFIKYCPFPLLLKLVARWLTRTQPIGTYPGWYFAKGEGNLATLAPLRLRVWGRFRGKLVDGSLAIPWYGNTTVILQLGNDVSRCAFVGGCYEPNEFALISRTLHKDMVFIDVGANEGLYSVYAAARVGPRGKVLAIEPSERELSRLRRNIARNKLDNVICVEAGLGAAPGSAEFIVAESEHAGLNSLRPFVFQIAIDTTYKIKIETLDSVFAAQDLRRVDFIKVDTEGSEAAILTGAREVLTRYRPLLMIEVNDDMLKLQGSSAIDLMRSLLELGYSLYRFSEETGLPVPTEPQERLGLNIVAMHRHRAFPGLLG